MYCGAGPARGQTPLRLLPLSCTLAPPPTTLISPAPDLRLWHPNALLFLLTLPLRTMACRSPNHLPPHVRHPLPAQNHHQILPAVPRSLQPSRPLAPSLLHTSSRHSVGKSLLKLRPSTRVYERCPRIPLPLPLVDGPQPILRMMARRRAGNLITRSLGARPANWWQSEVLRTTTGISRGSIHAPVFLCMLNRRGRAAYRGRCLVRSSGSRAR